MFSKTVTSMHRFMNRCRRWYSIFCWLCV